MGSLEGLNPEDLYPTSHLVFPLSFLSLPPSSLCLCLSLCQSLKTPLLHVQIKRSVLCIKSINSTCRYTALTQTGAECVLCARHVEAMERGRGRGWGLQSNRDVQNKTGERWRERGIEGRDGGSRQGGKLNVTSHI